MGSRVGSGRNRGGLSPGERRALHAALKRALADVRKGNMVSPARLRAKLERRRARSR